jgi:hypothetical protein
MLMPASCDDESEMDLFSMFFISIYFNVRSSPATPCATIVRYTEGLVVFSRQKIIMLLQGSSVKSICHLLGLLAASKRELVRKE